MEKNKQKGITLIALVITIVVLLILTGITINLTIGQDGIISRTKEAAEKTNKSQLEEQLELCKLEADLYNEEMKDILVKNGMITEENIEKNGISKINNNEKFLAISGSNGLKRLSSSLKDGNDYSGVVIYLLDDIIFDTVFDRETGELLSGEAFEPIGDSNSKIEEESLEDSIKKEFNGIFNGLNHEIKNLYINENSEGNYCTGLFGYIGEEGIVENIIISDSYISGNYETGSIVGRNRGTIKNCINKCLISGNTLTGGIAGRNCGTIENCINYGDIYTTGNQTGGIVANCDFGENVIVSNCKNYGDITSTSNTIGGIVGGAYRGDTNKEIVNVNVTINNCENYGNIGENEENCKYVGGIVGYSRAIVKNCINKGNTKGYQYIGGIVGVTNYYNSIYTLIENCKNYNSVVGNYTHIGGICGYNQGRYCFEMQ